MNAIAWSWRLEVSGGGTWVVEHAGLALLHKLADLAGLTGGLPKALPSDRLLSHDRPVLPAWRARSPMARR